MKFLCFIAVVCSLFALVASTDQAHKCWLCISSILFMLIAVATKLFVEFGEVS